MTDRIGSPGMNVMMPPPTTIYGERPTLAWIDKRSLIIDSRYQRTIESRRSQKIIEHIRGNFSWKKCGPLHVTDNGDGTWCVLDGQHRLAAVMPIADISDMPCWDLGEMTLQEQALAFVEINTSRVAVTPLAVHHARSKAGDLIAKQMDWVAACAGCEIRRTVVPLMDMKQGHMLCLATLKKGIALNGEKLVIAALNAVRKSFDDAGGIRSEILQAAMDMLRAGMAVEELSERLKRRRPEQVLAVAAARRAADPVRSVAVHVLGVLTETRGHK